MNKKDRYIASIREIEVRLQKGGDMHADLGNMIAVLLKRFSHFWIGVYYVQKDRLVLGPFQGPPACVYLSPDRGVCAACCKQKKSLVVPDVHQFEGHVACDPRSRSEIVVPLFDEKGDIRAVFDVDSDQLDAFDEIDQEYLELIAGHFSSRWT